MPRGTTAIILIGGGMRSAHGAGFLYALGNKKDIDRPDILIASSGNAANACYFLAEQYESSKRIWTELLSTWRFICKVRFWRIMDIDYLIDVVFKTQEPLKMSAVNDSSGEYLIPITNASTGHTRYVQKSNGLDLFEVLRAAKAIPIFFGRKVMVNGAQYIDGEVGPTMLDHVQHALECGAKRIVIVDNSSRHSHANDLATCVYSHFASKGLGEAVCRDIAQNAVCVVASEATVLCVRPNLSIGSLESARVKLEATFEHGVADMLALEDELRTLFI